MRDLTLHVREGLVSADLGQGIRAEGEFSMHVTAAELAELTWFTESGAAPLFGPENERASVAAGSLADFGSRLFDSVAGDPALGVPLVEILASTDPRSLRLTIISPNPAVLSLPWELARCRVRDRTLVLAALGEIVRVPELNSRSQRRHAPVKDDGAPLKVLMVSPRPRRAADLPRGHTIGPAVAAATAYPGEISLRVVRPATVAAFEEALAAPGGHDVVHFDGHGVYVEEGETLLQFEATGSAPATLTGAEFAALVAAASPRVVLINACRSSFAAAESPSPSVAAAAAAELKDAVVIGMRFAVTPPLVEELLSTFYPHLVATGSASSAVARVRHSLLGKWSESSEEDRLPAAPSFASLTVYASDPTALKDHAAGSPTARPVAPLDWRRSKVMSWWEDLELLEAIVLRTQAPLLIQGALGAGKTSLAEAFAEYATVTGLLEQSPAIIDVSADQAGEVDEIASRNTRRTADGRLVPPILCGHGRIEDASTAVFRIGEPPMQLVAMAVEPTLEKLREDGSDEAEGVFFRFLSLAGPHLGTLKALVDAAEAGAPVAGLVDDLAWGATPGPWLRVAEVDAALSKLDPERLRVASLLGLFDGWVMPILLIAMTDGRLPTGKFDGIFGRRVDMAEWEETLGAMEELGLAQGGSPLDRAAVRIPPIVGLALRERLCGWLDDEQALDDLQSDMAHATSGFATLIGNIGVWQQDGATWWAAREEKHKVLLFVEANITRGLVYALRRGDDRLANKLLAPYFRESMPGGETYQLGLALASGYLRLELGDGDSCSRFRALVPALLSLAAEADEDWQKCLTHAQEFIATGFDLREDAGIPRMRILIAQARALWRSDAADVAESVLRQAGEECLAAGELEAVASAADDMATFLRLGEPARGDLRDRIGVAQVPSSEQTEAIQAEDEGEFDRAYDYWLAEVRTSERLGDEVRNAFARTEIGRLCALHKERAHEARTWLRSALEKRSRLRLEVAAVLLYLGLAAEVDDSLDEAESWLIEARKRCSEEANASSSLLADCIYELGIVQARKNDLDAARESFRTALRLYVELNLDAYRADTHWALGQVEQIAGNKRRSADHFNAAVNLGIGSRSQKFVIADVQQAEDEEGEGEGDD